MKTMKIKSVLFTWMVTIIAIAGFSGFAFGQTTASTVKYSGNFNREKVAVNRDLASISLQQEKVKSLEKQISDERAAKEKTCSSRADLARAKADLQRQKDYLKADKAELMGKHQELIADREKAIRRERAAVMTAQQKLRADLAKDRTDAVPEAQAVVNKKYELKHTEAALKQAKIERNNELLVVNKQIKNANGESPVTLAFENGYAKTQNLAMK